MRKLTGSSLWPKLLRGLLHVDLYCFENRRLYSGLHCAGLLTKILSATSFVECESYGDARIVHVPSVDRGQRSNLLRDLDVSAELTEARGGAARRASPFGDGRVRRATTPAKGRGTSRGGGE